MKTELEIETARDRLAALADEYERLRVKGRASKKLGAQNADDLIAAEMKLRSMVLTLNNVLYGDQPLEQLYEDDQLLQALRNLID